MFGERVTCMTTGSSGNVRRCELYINFPSSMKFDEKQAIVSAASCSFDPDKWHDDLRTEIYRRIGEWSNEHRKDGTS